MTSWNKEFQRLHIGFHDIDGKMPKYVNCLYLETDDLQLKDFCELFVLEQDENQFHKMYLVQNDETLKIFEGTIDEIKVEALQYIWNYVSTQASFYLKISDELQRSMLAARKVCREDTPPNSTKPTDSFPSLPLPFVVDGEDNYCVFGWPEMKSRDEKNNSFSSSGDSLKDLPPMTKEDLFRGPFGGTYQKLSGTAPIVGSIKKDDEAK